MSKSIKYQVLSVIREWKWIILTGLGIVVLYFVLRLINLTILPIFADEAIYIRWSQVMKAESTLRFLPLSDGKQPLFMWLTIPFLKFFADPLFAGRFVSVFSGFLSLVGIFVLVFLITKSKWASLFSAFLYTITPYTYFFDRMALVDSLLFSFGIWVFILTFLLAKYKRLDLAIFTGIVLGGGLITKSPALFYAILMPALFLLLQSDKKRLPKNILKTAGLFVVAYIFAFGIYNLLRLGPNFHMIALRNKDYVFPISEVLKHPHDPILVHLGDIKTWFPNLFTWPVLTFSFLGFLVGFLDKGKRKVTLVLLAWFLVPLLAQSAIAKVFAPRYLLFTLFPLFIFASFLFEYLLARFKKFRFLPILLLGVLAILPLSYDFTLAKNPQKAPLPEKMRTGYLEEWTSGYGINEVRDYIKEVSKESHVNVGTEGYFGTLPDGLQIYFDKDPNVTVFGIGLSLLDVPEPLKESAAAGEAQTFLVVNDSRIGAKNSPLLELVLQVPKAKGKKGQDSLLLYRVK